MQGARVRSLVKELRAQVSHSWQKIYIIIITATKWKQGFSKQSPTEKYPWWQSTSSQQPRSPLALPLSWMAVCTGFLSWPESLQLGFWEDWTLTLGRDMTLFAVGSWQAYLHPSFIIMDFTPDAFTLTWERLLDHFNSRVTCTVVLIKT